MGSSKPLDENCSTKMDYLLKRVILKNSWRAERARPEMILTEH
jgi:hypothetical protein